MLIEFLFLTIREQESRTGFELPSEVRNLAVSRRLFFVLGAAPLVVESSLIDMF